VRVAREKQLRILLPPRRDQDDRVRVAGASRWVERNGERRAGTKGPRYQLTETGANGVLQIFLVGTRPAHIEQQSKFRFTFGIRAGIGADVAVAAAVQAGEKRIEGTREVSIS